MTTPPEAERGIESREQYAERYLLGRIFEIVQHYDTTAVANPPVVRETVEHIIATLVTPHHQELQKAERERCIEVVKNYGKKMSKLQQEMIGKAHDDCKQMLAYDMHSRLIAVKHITEKINQSVLDQPTV